MRGFSWWLSGHSNQQCKRCILFAGPPTPVALLRFPAARALVPMALAALIPVLARLFALGSHGSTGSRHMHLAVPQQLSVSVRFSCLENLLSQAELLIFVALQPCPRNIANFASTQVVQALSAVGFEPTRSYLQWILSPPP